MRTTNTSLTIAATLIALWLAAALLLPCGSGNGIARRTQLLAEAAQMSGREVTLEELEGAVGGMQLDIGVTRYTPDIQYHSATRWTVRLSAQPVRAYAAASPAWIRLLTLNFRRIDYPAIEFSSVEKRIISRPTER